MQEPDKEAQRRLNIIEYIEKQANSIKAGCIYLGIPSSTEGQALFTQRSSKYTIFKEQVLLKAASAG